MAGMKQVLLMIAVVALVGCGKKETPKPQEQTKAPSKPTVPDSKKSQPKPTPKKKTPKPKPEPTKAKATAGVKLWEFETGFTVSSSPAIGSDGTVYVGSIDSKLHAIKTESLGPANSPWPMFRQNSRHTGRAPAK